MLSVLNKRLCAGLIAGALMLSAGGFAPLAAQEIPNDFTAIVREKIPAVVAITTKQIIQDQGTLGDFLSPFGSPGLGPAQPQVREALGSGFVISPDGYIVTNNHVVADASEIHVVFSDKENLPAQLVGRDPATDLAVLKIEPRPNMTTTAWGDSDAVQPGAWTIAIGSPFGLGGTVTVGVLSARSRDINAGPYDDFLQTDASINRGNSGGPLFNARGEVIGVNTAIVSPTGGSIGIGFAVPSRTARNVVDQLIRTGRIERGYIGVRLQEITPSIAEALGIQGSKGALVASVEPGSPAEQAGIQAGDVITRFNGKDIQSVHDLTLAAASQKPGTRTTLTRNRGGSQQEIALTIGQRDDEEQQQTGAVPRSDTADARLGLSLSPIPDEARQQLGLEPDTTGVFVQEVAPNSLAAENGFQPGDVIVSANNRNVTQPSDIQEEWERSRQQNKPILFRISRQGQSLFVAVATAKS
ncbi:Do family serine endopeptidase [Mesorhizobium sp.]|uniref:Do family serine endopeptidase n=1 Tax=Mesorhizobium sp. TaxID=1871066 RepID=UPI000FEA13CF|nr:Do family serine endopeptidase [Mesorhizobium sp.]RWK42891.1 MAG: Do family serine endopeptidase [Mesorhizobium sp.]RWK70352.1 MAG: Do family serine endopeptidase [Mesorhizobium sp.]RWK80614.1 MAG: Do family serine endopeptidase [Mesorhizobium sp.]RWK83170.1 MAG: Do family serine endopeptidase [Mesorhizobium sp.]RWL09072.1 MAG: Do family serine endopeptidase [Mesorhizobium sp.]